MNIVAVVVGHVQDLDTGEENGEVDVAVFEDSALAYEYIESVEVRVDVFGAVAVVS